MKKTHEYNTNFKEEYKKALQFLKKGCKCGCSTKLSQKEYAERKVAFQNLSKKEQDSVLMGQLMAMDEGEETTSSRFPIRERTKLRTFYRWNNKIPLCQETYLNMLGISRDYLEEVRNHLSENNLLTRIHGNTGRTPHWKTKANIDQKVKGIVKKFLEKYAQEHGLPDPGSSKRGKHNTTFLPADTTYKSVYLKYINDWKINSDFRQFKYLTFIRLWKEVTPDIKIRSPRSDLCDACHKLKNEIHSCKDEKERETQKKNFFGTENRKKRKENTITET